MANPGTVRRTTLLQAIKTLEITTPVDDARTIEDYAESHFYIEILQTRIVSVTLNKYFLAMRSFPVLDTIRIELIEDIKDFPETINSHLWKFEFLRKLTFSNVHPEKLPKLSLKGTERGFAASSRILCNVTFIRFEINAEEFENFKVKMNQLRPTIQFKILQNENARDD